MTDQMLDMFAECTCTYEPMYRETPAKHEGPSPIGWRRTRNPNCTYHNPPAEEAEEDASA